MAIKVHFGGNTLFIAQSLLQKAEILIVWGKQDAEKDNCVPRIKCQSLQK